MQTSDGRLDVCDGGRLAPVFDKFWRVRIVEPEEELTADLWLYLHTGDLTPASIMVERLTALGGAHVSAGVKVEQVPARAGHDLPYAASGGRDPQAGAVRPGGCLYRGVRVGAFSKSAPEGVLAGGVLRSRWCPFGKPGE